MQQNQQTAFRNRSGGDRRASWKQTASLAAICAAAAWPGAARGDVTIDSGSTVLASGIGTSAAPTFRGGTLQIDSATTLANNFAVEDYPNNTIDADGHAATLSGAFTGAGPLTFADTVGGGNVTLTNSGNTYTGITAVNSGTTLSLSGTGTISTSSSLGLGGTFDISQTTSGASIISLTGTGTLNLGAQSLTLSDAAGSFTGTINGTGGLILTAGTESLGGANTYTGGTTINGGTLQIGAGGTSGSIAGNVYDLGTLAFFRTDSVSFGGTISGTGGVSQTGGGTTTLTAVNTYTGVTSITAGTLALAGGGSIAASSSVADAGVFDISATSGASIKSLAGTGVVELGGQTLTITTASGAFSGVIQGSGGIILNGGTQLLTGANTYTGATIINAGTLAVGSSSYSANVADNGTFAFSSSGDIAMSGIVSGAGGVSQIGAGTTTITSVQAYSGLTTISAGTLALAAGGSIASSSGVLNNGILSISAATGGASITSLSGNGTVQLGADTLTLTNATGTFLGGIFGNGGLTLAGGNETLSGANGFTGNTTISAGTLYVGGATSLASSANVIDNATLDISGVTSVSGSTSTSIASLSGSGTVLLGTKTLIVTSASGTFSGIIAGSGNLTITGGTQTLTGANTYTGVTTISAGTLALAGNGSLSSASAIVNNATLDISGAAASAVSLPTLSGSGVITLGTRSLNFVNASGSFSGTILGAGGVIVSGGTEIFASDNSYTGGTTIAAGSLQIGRGAGSGSILGDVADYGTLVFDRLNSYVFSGAISGPGKVNQIGDGTTILTGANSYTGGTTITTGTLQIGNGGTSGAITGDVTDNGTLAFARSDTTSFAGTISGSGGVTVVNGATILTAVNTYTGATAINSGAALILTGPASIAASSAVADDGTFDVSSASNAPRIASLSGTGNVTLGSQTLTITNAAGTFSGNIAGSGGLVVNGGLQTLSGTNSYTGATTINGGTLAINGAIASSSVTVNSGGTLAGSGTVSSVAVASGGTVAPGVAGVGTLAVNGSVAFSSGSDLLINLTSASAPKLSVTGAETLAGTLTVASADGTYLVGQKLTVLTAAGGVSGSFTLAPLPSSGAKYTSSLSYDANDVYLQINLAQLSPLLPSGATANQAGVVGGIDAAIAAGSTVPAAFQALGNLSGAALASDATQLSGEIGSDIPEAGDALFDSFMDTIFNHIRDRQNRPSRRNSPAPSHEAWVSGFAGTTLIAGDSDADLQKLRTNVSGFAGGADWTISPSFTLGGALSAGSANFHLAADTSRGSASGVQGAVYGLLQLGPRFYGSFAAAFALDNITTHRLVTVSGSDDLAGKISAAMYGLRYETGLDLGWITPYLAVEDKLFQAPAYTETAASGAPNYALSYASHTSNDAELELGARQSGSLPLNSNWTLNLSDRLAWRHDTQGAFQANPAFAALPASDFTADGLKPGEDVALISLGTDLRSRAGLDFSLDLETSVSPKSQTYTGTAGINYNW